MDTGARKSTITAVSAAALIAAGQYDIAAGLVALYLVLNTFLHARGSEGVDDGPVEDA